MEQELLSSIRVYGFALLPGEAVRAVRAPERPRPPAARSYQGHILSWASGPPLLGDPKDHPPGALSRLKQGRVSVRHDQGADRTATGAVLDDPHALGLAGYGIDPGAQESRQTSPALAETASETVAGAVRAAPRVLHALGRAARALRRRASATNTRVPLVVCGPPIDYNPATPVWEGSGKGLGTAGSVRRARARLCMH